MRKDVAESGGLSADQFEVKWTPGNAAGVSALVEVVDGDGRPWKILMDVGWDAEYMDAVFRREGGDRLLADGKIDFVYITHEHVDHFWGLPAVVRNRPDVKLVIPTGFRSAAWSAPAVRPPGGGRRDAARRARAVPGRATVTFDIPIFLKTLGEQVLYVNPRGKGS
jgi:7,8-dihydropterin-6-yl-methyl-4-(beta-D-ribofuranosyl)aminobenzene 5'-phosphate synthase